MNICILHQVPVCTAVIPAGQWQSVESALPHLAPACTPQHACDIRIVTHYITCAVTQHRTCDVIVALSNTCARLKRDV